MPLKYSHTQPPSRLLGGIAVFLLFDLILVELLIYVLGTRGDDALPQNQLLLMMLLVPLIPVLVLGWTFIMMSSLTVTLDETAVRVRFGGGFWHKTIPLEKITHVRPVRPSWMLGWGIRMYKNGWLYNIAGRDAVELTLVSGRKVAIGTDEPQKLADAIANAIQAYS